MDDLSEKLDRLLGSPDGLKRIEELMATLGGTASPTAAPPPTSPEPSDAMSSLLGGLDMEHLFRLMPLIGEWQKEDDSAALLQALRPHLKDERQKRLDEAEHMLKLMKLLPLLKEFSGKGDENS